MYIDDRAVTPDDFGQLDQIVKKIQKEKQTFDRLELTKEDLLQMFEVGGGRREGWVGWGGRGGGSEEWERAWWRGSS